MQLKSLQRIRYVLGAELPNDSLLTTLSSKVILMEFILTFILVAASSYAINVIFHFTKVLSFVQFASLIICELVLTVAIVASYLATRKYWN